ARRFLALSMARKPDRTLFFDLGLAHFLVKSFRKALVCLRKIMSGKTIKWGSCLPFVFFHAAILGDETTSPGDRDASRRFLASVRQALDDDLPETAIEGLWIPLDANQRAAFFFALGDMALLEGDTDAALNLYRGCQQEVPNYFEFDVYPAFAKRRIAEIEAR